SHSMTPITTLFRPFNHYTNKAFAMKDNAPKNPTLPTNSARSTTHSTAQCSPYYLSSLLTVVVRGEFLDQVVDETLGVAEQHESPVHVVQRIVDTGKSWAHAALYHHHGARLIHIQHRHAENGTAGIGARGRDRKSTR